MVADVVIVVMLILSLPALINFRKVQKIRCGIRRPVLTFYYDSFPRRPWGHALCPPRAPPTTSQGSCLLAPQVLSWDRAESTRLQEVVAGNGERMGVRLCYSEAGWLLGIHLHDLTFTQKFHLS